MAQLVMVLLPKLTEANPWNYTVQRTHSSRLTSELYMCDTYENEWFLFGWFVLFFPPSPTLSPWCCVRPWLWCCCIFPLRTPSTALCVGSPVLVLCAWASLQGLGSQSSPTPQHWNLFVFSSLGMEGKGSFKRKRTLTPIPYAAPLPREK